MCRAIECEVCGKTTWTGCGQHIDSVKVNVAPEDWCDGAESHAETVTVSA